MSTGEPSGSSHGQPLNCQAGPCTNTATTRSLQREGRGRGGEHTPIGCRFTVRRSLSGRRRTWGGPSPVLGSQFERLVDDPVRHRDAQGGSAGLDLVFAPLQQHLVVPLDALLLLVFRCDEPGEGSGAVEQLMYFRKNVIFYRIFSFFKHEVLVM